MIKKDGPSRKEVEESVKNAIREYVDSHNRNREPIKNKNQIIDDLEKNNQTYGLSHKTLYRYLDQMNCKEIQAGKYDFVDESNKYPFKDLLVYQKYNKILCYTIDIPSCGYFLAESINEYYASKNMEDIFHCTAVGDILICFYYYKKGETNTLIRKKIKEDIKKILKKGCIYFSDL